MRHGIAGYKKRGCRCAVCTGAYRRYQRDYKAEYRRRFGGTLAPDDPRHGTIVAYSNYMCRCEPCRRVHAADCVARRARKALA